LRWKHAASGVVVAALLVMKLPGQLHRHVTAEVEIDLLGPPGHSVMVVRFLLPVGRYRWRPTVSVSADPAADLLVKEVWLDPHLLVATVTEIQPPFGRRLDYRIRAPVAWAALAGLDLRGSFRQPVVPAIRTLEPETVPSRGPVTLRLNTFVTLTDLRQRLVVRPEDGGAPATGSLLGVEGDPACWQFHPDPPLRGGQRYRVVVEPGLKGPEGAVAGRLEAGFRVAPAVRWLRYPEQPLSLYPELVFEADQELAEVRFALWGVPGETTVTGSRVTFRPARALLPGTVYLASVRAWAASGEQAPELWLPLRTQDLTGYWVEVCLTPPQTVRVYRGTELVRVLLASAGTATHPTPVGTFRVAGRGEYFWNPRYGEGAYYWVRFHGSYLFHSVPCDATGAILPHEELKLGWPASHGCVRLDLADARWLYEHLPDGSPVIVHP